MSVIPQVITEDRASGAQFIDGSLKFVSGNSNHLARTPSSSGNRKTWTWSGWVKRATLGSTQVFFHAYDGSASNRAQFGINASNKFYMNQGGGSGVNYGIGTSDAVFRDVSAWYHFVMVADYGNTDFTLYVNGVEQSITFSTSIVNDNGQINGAFAHQLGSISGSSAFFDGYLSEVNFIDGSALDASYFGFTDPLTNTWRPKKYTGTYGTNGFYLPMDGNSPIGEDKSGRGNNWTPVNFGGSIDITKATGALPILNTLGGTIARPGVFGSEVGAYYAVTVPGGIGGGFYLDGIQKPALNLIRGATYTFDQSDSSNSSHPLVFGTTADGNDYSDGVTTNGTPGSAGAYTKITVPHNAPDTLYYHCSAHGGMGSSTSQTTDETKADPYAWKCVLALPLGGDANDVSNQINSGSTTKTFTANGGIAASTLQSNFYGGSFYSDGNGDWLSSSASEDFSIGTGDFTLEAWFNVASSQTANARLFAQDTNNNTSWDCYIDGTSVTGNIMMHGGLIDLGMSFGTANTWHHFCIVRSSGTLYSFMDGVLKNTQAYTYSFGNNTDEFRIFQIGSNYNSDIYSMNGYVQDFRIYKGVAKYTSNFIPASPRPDILPDTPSGVAYGSELKQITEGSVNGGVSNGDTLLVGNSSDFSFGSGDFTVELFAYHTSTAGNDTLVGVWNSGSNRRSWMIDIEADQGRLRGYWSTDGSNNTAVQTATKYIARRRWNHIVFCRQGNTMRLYLNGNQEATATESGSLYSNVNDSLGILSATDAGNDPCRGHISNVRIIKGTCLYPDGTSFTPPSAPLTNVTNTVLLACQSPTSATAYEVSPGAITTSGSVSASSFNPFTDDINTVRGQENAYCVLSQAATFNGDGGDIQDGGLKFECPASGDASTRGTIPIPAGSKFYMEAKYKVAAGSSGQARLGIAQVQQGFTKSGTGIWSIDFRGSAGTIQKDDQGSLTTLTGNPSDGDTVGIKIDLATGEFRAHHRGIYYNGGNALMTGIPNVESYFFAALDGGINRNDWEEVNFGQKPWKYPPGDGYQPLCSANLPRPTEAAVRPDKYFKTVLWTGDDSTDRPITTGFRPDFVWVKSRNQAYSNHLYDSVRGPSLRLLSNGTQTEFDQTSIDGVSSFNSDGFDVSNTNAVGVNQLNTTYVAWCWKAGTPYTPTVTGGFSSPSASINRETGFGIYKVTGSNSQSSFTTGLNQQADFIMCKNLDNTYAWGIYHRSHAGNAPSAKFLNYNYAVPSDKASTLWYQTGTTIEVNSYAETGSNGDYIYYVWHNVPGFSKFGSYTGNTSTNGPLIECGFKPAWVLIKSITVDTSWYLFDDVRGSIQTQGSDAQVLFPDNAVVEDANAGQGIDFLSNGFKVRSANGYGINNSETYIYAAFAEAPTFNLYGGQANAR